MDITFTKARIQIDICDMNNGMQMYLEEATYYSNKLNRLISTTLDKPLTKSVYNENNKTGITAMLYEKMYLDKLIEALEGGL